MKLKVLNISLLTIGFVVSMAASAWAKEIQPIAQPLPLKLGITLAGLGLVALELWWFLGQKR